MTGSDVQAGGTLPASQYIAASEKLHAWTRRVASWWAGGFDLLLTPTLAEPPPRLGTISSAAGAPDEVLGRVAGLIPFTPPFNLSGCPAMSVPLHWTRQGLPLGMQFTGRMCDEYTLYQLAGQLERAQPWFDRVPAG